MAQRHQRGWLKKERRKEGETWMLYFRTLRESDGKRVENKTPIGLVKKTSEQGFRVAGGGTTASSHQRNGLSGTRDVCRSS
jgi:hypothetical protein